MLNLRKSLLVGHSMGGAVSLAIALDHPDIVGGLALVAPLTHPVDKPPAPFESLAIQSDLRRWIIAWTVATPISIHDGEKLLAEVFEPDPAPADFPTKAGGLLSLRPSAFESASLDMVSANVDLPEMVRLYPKLTMPLSVLYGTEDHILDYRAHGIAMKEALPSADVELTSGGHMLPMSHPDRTAEFIRKAASRPDLSRAAAAGFRG